MTILDVMGLELGPRTLGFHLTSMTWSACMNMSVSVRPSHPRRRVINDGRIAPSGGEVSWIQYILLFQIGRRRTEMKQLRCASGGRAVLESFECRPNLTTEKGEIVWWI